MIRLLILFSVVFTLGVLYVGYSDAFAAPCTPGNHCYSQIKTDRLSPINGIQYELDSTDLYIDRNSCRNIAVSTGWLVANKIGDNDNREWVESGITKGELRMGGTADPECITKLSTYYTINNIVNDFPRYQEYLVGSGAF